MILRVPDLMDVDDLLSALSAFIDSVERGDEPEYPAEVRQLADEVVGSPPLSEDKGDIEKWAKRIADDVSTIDD